MHIGFIGLGVMGKPMALHLINAGYQLSCCINVSDIAPDLLEAGIHISDSPSGVAAQSDIIITMLPDTPDVEKVLLGENGVLSAIDAGKVIIDMSSISPKETRRFATLAHKAGCEFLDAPVSGGQAGAEQGSLSIMAGGDSTVFERVKPLFEIMGSNITHVGEVGAGQICKIANQVVVALNIEAVSEALVFASRAGVEPSTVRQALMGGFASSKVLETHGQKMIERKFEPGFRIDLHRKDLNLALQTAQELGVSLPNTSTTSQLFNGCAALSGGGNLDHSALITVLERLSDHKIDD